MNRAEPREITESFRLERVLKSSRSAIVFRAAGPGTGAPVAIKLIPPSSPTSLESCRERFLAAMGVLESARPENFPALLDYGFCPDGSAFMVMELVDGERLDSLTGVQPERALRLVLGALEGIEVLARNGISHGNLAPENLLAAGEGGTERVMILGFGTAAFHGGIAGIGGSALTEGPAQFAAPEQLDSVTALTADWRSDLYALAASACALLGAEAFPADAPAPSVSLPATVRERLADPTALQVIVEQSLRREPAERPTSLEEFRKAVNTALVGAPAEPGPSGEVATRTLAMDIAAISPSDLVSETPAEDVVPPVESEVTGSPTIRAILPVQSPEEAAIQPAPSPTTPAGAPPTTPAVEKVKTGPVPIQRLAELPTAPFAVRQPEPQAGVEPPPPSEPMPATEPAPPSASDQRGEPEVVTPVAVGAPAEEHPTSEAAPGPSEPARAKATPKPHRTRAFLPWAGGIAAIVVLASVAGLFWVVSQRTEKRVPSATPTAAPRRPSPSPQPVQVNAPVAQLERAEAAVALGDLAAAGAALDAISPEDLAGLSQAEQERYKTIRASYETMRRQALTKAMQRALAAGNLRALGDAVRDISREEEASFKRDADFSASLDEGRRALNLQATLLKAQRQGDLAQVLQSASVLIEVVPRYAQAAEAREKAAASLEREADTLAAKGSFDLALARLDTVRRSWPTRAGLQGRLERIKAEQEAEQKFTSLMAQAQQTETDKAPEKGLELLNSLPTDPRTAERVRQVRERLAKQLEQLDAQPPTIALAPGPKLEYKKGGPVTLAFKIQDDHGVKSAQLFARIEGSGRFVELPLRHVAGADWSAEISVSFHQNQTVEFYAVATDHSGHTAQLGKPQEPLKLKRKKNIFGF